MTRDQTGYFYRYKRPNKPGTSNYVLHFLTNARSLCGIAVTVARHFAFCAAGHHTFSGGVTCARCKRAKAKRLAAKGQ